MIKFNRWKELNELECVKHHGFMHKLSHFLGIPSIYMCSRSLTDKQHQELIENNLTYNVADFKPWEVWEFPWGTATKHHSGRWEKAFLKPSGQEIDLSKLSVILHDNGIEFY